MMAPAGKSNTYASAVKGLSSGNLGCFKCNSNDRKLQETIISLQHTIFSLKSELKKIKEENNYLRTEARDKDGVFSEEIFSSDQIVNCEKWCVPKKVSRRNKNSNSNVELSLLNTYNTLNDFIESDESVTSPIITKPVKRKSNLLKEKRKSFKIELFGDSHGRGISVKLNEQLSDCEVTGIIKPSAKFSSVVEGINNEESDIKVVLAGSNDVSCNEADRALGQLKNILDNKRYSESNIVIVNLPQRYDLIKNSCVNREIRKTNKKLKLMCSMYSKANLIDVGNLDRNLHTKHGQHLNRKGKNFLVTTLCKVVTSLKGKMESSPIVSGNLLHPVIAKVR